MTAIKQLGEADVVIGADRYTVRIGVLEFAALESEFAAEGMNEVWTKAKENSGNWLKFARVVLKRRNPDLDDDRIADIVDYYEMRKGVATKLFAEAVVEAMDWAMPKQDPNVQPATETPASETSV